MIMRSIARLRMEMLPLSRDEDFVRVDWLDGKDGYDLSAESKTSLRDAAVFSGIRELLMSCPGVIR